MLSLTCGEVLTNVKYIERPQQVMNEIGTLHNVKYLEA